MIVNPRIGSVVQVWYRRDRAAFFPLHGRTGTVVIRSRGPGPRNHGIEVDGRLYVVPCGNLRTLRLADAADTRGAGLGRGGEG